jgi:hypothetical protein
MRESYSRSHVDRRSCEVPSRQRSGQLCRSSLYVEERGERLEGFDRYRGLCFTQDSDSFVRLIMGLAGPIVVLLGQVAAPKPWHTRCESQPQLDCLSMLVPPHAYYQNKPSLP